MGLHTRCAGGVPVYAVAYREGVMMRLVEDYKYKSVRATAEVLAEMMAAVIPREALVSSADGGLANRGLSAGEGLLVGGGSTENVIVVPLPTIRRHIRERGFDHTWLLARKLARLRGFRTERILERRNKTVQVGANEEQRKRQAKEAYGVRRSALRARRGDSLDNLLDCPQGDSLGGLDPEATYLLIDDVWTTGASMEAAVRVMREAGAQKIVAAVILVARGREKGNAET